MMVKWSRSIVVIIKWVVILALVAAIVVAAFAFDTRAWVKGALIWIDGLGAWAPPVFIGLYIAVTILLGPAWLLTLGAGALFGVFYGSLYVSLGSTIGATCSFILGRSLARDMVSKRLRHTDKLRLLDDAIARDGWKIVGLARLSPVFPFTTMNYVFGLTRVSLRQYVAASWAGMIPATLLYVYLGSLGRNVAAAGVAERARGKGEWFFFALGLLATVAVTIYVTRVARRVLRGAVGE